MHSEKAKVYYLGVHDYDVRTELSSSVIRAYRLENTKKELKKYLDEAHKILPEDIQGCVVIVPVHREHKVLPLEVDSPHPVILVVNDFYDAWDEYFKRNLDREKVLPHLEDGRITSYIGEDITETYPEYPHALADDRIVNEEVHFENGSLAYLYQIVGVMIESDETETQKYIRLWHYGLFDDIEKMLTGKMLNLLRAGEIEYKIARGNTQLGLIDTTGIRDSEVEDEHSIGRARMLPVLALLDRAGSLPIIWLDADTLPEPGYTDRLSHFYEVNPLVQASISLPRVIPRSELENFHGVYTYSLTYLYDLVMSLDKPGKFGVGGPRLACRLSLYQTEVSVDLFDKGIHTQSILDLVAACAKDEDFALHSLLKSVLQPAEMVHIPERVWIDPRGEERSNLTAISGDSQADVHRFPSRGRSLKNQNEMMEKIQLLLTRWNIHCQLETSTIELFLQSLAQLPEIKAEIRTEGAQLWKMTHNFNFEIETEGRDDDELEYSLNYLSENIKMSLIANAIQVWLVKKRLEELGYTY